MNLQIDNRVGAKELSPYVNVKHELARLKYGDISFMGNGPDGLVIVGIERKRVGDLLSSIATGRLSGHQLIGMLQSFHYSYLLIEGLWQSNPKQGILEVYRAGKWKALEVSRRHWMAREVNNYLNTLAVKCNIKVWRTANKSQSGRWIGDLYAWWQKPWDKHRAHTQFHVEPIKGAYLKTPNIVHRMVKEVKGVGWDKGEVIAKRFKTVFDLVMASKEELMSIPGIGNKLADNIIKELRG